MTTTQKKKVNDMRNLMACALAAGLLAGCAGSTKTTKTAGSGTEGEDTGSMAGATERETISKAGADQIIPKEKKRNISADQRADFEKAMKRYADARKDGAISGGECSGVSDAFKRVADDNPGLMEARFNQGAVLYECGKEDEAASVWKGLKYGPAITNLGYIAWKNNEMPSSIDNASSWVAGARRGARTKRSDT